MYSRQFGSQGFVDTVGQCLFDRMFGVEQETVHRISLRMIAGFVDIVFGKIISWSKTQSSILNSLRMSCITILFSRMGQSLRGELGTNQESAIWEAFVEMVGKRVRIQSQRVDLRVYLKLLFKASYSALLKPDFLRKR